MSAMGTSVRFCSPRSEVMSLPLRSSTTEDCAVSRSPTVKSGPNNVSKSLVSKLQPAAITVIASNAASQ